MSDIKAECVWLEESLSAFLEQDRDGRRVHIQSNAGFGDPTQTISIAEEEFIRWSDAVKAAIEEAKKEETNGVD